MKEGVHKPRYSKKEVSQRFNLKKLLGYSPTQAQKEFFYSRVVEIIQDRTQSGKDINNKNFKKYSKSYAEQKGVSRDSVDLTLEGDMLASMENSQGNQRNIVKVKMEEGVETLKSYNHNVGDTLPRRTYFGVVSNQEINAITKQTDDFGKAQVASSATTDGTTTIDLAELREQIGFLGLEQEF